MKKRRKETKRTTLLGIIRKRGDQLSKGNLDAAEQVKLAIKLTTAVLQPTATSISRTPPILHPMSTTLEANLHLRAGMWVVAPVLPAEITQIILNRILPKISWYPVPHHPLTGVAALPGLHCLIKRLANLSHPPKEVGVGAGFHRRNGPHLGLLRFGLVR